MNNKETNEQSEIISTNVGRARETNYEKLAREQLKIHNSERGIELSGGRKPITIGKGYPDQ